MVLDISKHQGVIDWDALAPRLQFVFMRATGDGVSVDGVDLKFYENVKACVQRKIPFHVYHFLRAKTIKMAAEEAMLFYGTASSFDPISYVVDVEGEMLQLKNVIEITQSFVDTLRSLGAKKIGLYTGNSAYTEFGFGKVQVDYLWIARHGSNIGYPDKMPTVECDIWQYTSTAHVLGIHGNVDADCVFGTKPDQYFTERSVNPMAKVLLGSARIDENGKAHGGKAGNQTGKELSTQNWYKHEKGWRVFRPVSKEYAERIAWDMASACENMHIGYDQYERDTLYTTSKPLGFNCAKVETDCETDCSALVRVCCCYAGIFLKNFNTETEPQILLDSGKFVELTGSMFTDSQDYLKRGDILVTASKGHTVVVLSNGAKAYEITEDFKRTLQKGCKGEDVAELQRKLIALGYDLGSWKDDGDYGTQTVKAVKAFQKDNGLFVDGVFDEESYKALEKATAKVNHKVRITGGNCWVRTAPNTSAQTLGVAKAGEEFDWGFTTADNGWQLIDYHNQNGWVSGRYGKLVE